MIKPAVWVACLTPLALLIYHFVRNELSANPVEDITNTTGIWTLRFIEIGRASCRERVSPRV